MWLWSQDRGARAGPNPGPCPSSLGSGWACELQRGACQGFPSAQCSLCGTPGGKVGAGVPGRQLGTGNLGRDPSWNVSLASPALPHILVSGGLAPPTVQGNPQHQGVLMHPAGMEEKRHPDAWTLPKATPIAFQILSLSGRGLLTLALLPAKSRHTLHGWPRF